MRPNEIHTDRLLLRPIKMEDAGSLWFDCFEKYKEFRYQTSVASDYGELTRWIRKVVSKYEGPWEHMLWGIKYKENGRVIGIVEIRGDSIGYNVSPYYRDKGIATEAAKAAIGYVFAVTNRDYIEAECAVENIQSMRVLNKCGFQRYGITRKNYFAGNCLTYRYILFREDWK